MTIVFIDGSGYNDYPYFCKTISCWQKMHNIDITCIIYRNKKNTNVSKLIKQYIRENKVMGLFIKKKKDAIHLSQHIILFIAKKYDNIKHTKKNYTIWSYIGN